MKSKLNIILYAKMLRELQEGPCTVAELMDETGFGRQSMQRYMRTLHQARCVHIGDWESTGKGRRAVYVLGAGKDAERPPTQTKSANQAKYRQNKRFKIVTRLAA